MQEQYLQTEGCEDEYAKLLEDQRVALPSAYNR